MDDRKKLVRLRLIAATLYFLVIAAWIYPIVLGIVFGAWWTFAIGAPVSALLAMLTVRYYYRRTAFVCPYDGTVFRPPVQEILSADSTQVSRELTCPECGRKDFCLEIYAPDYEPHEEDGYLIWE